MYCVKLGVCGEQFDRQGMIEVLVKQKREVESSIEKSKNVADEIERSLIRKKEDEASTELQLQELKNFGRKSANEVFAALKNKLGITLS